MARPPRAAAGGDWMAWKVPLETEDDIGTELLWSHNRGDFNAAQGAGGKNGATREIAREARIGSAKKRPFLAQFASSLGKCE